MVCLCMCSDNFVVILQFVISVVDAEKRQRHAENLATQGGHGKNCMRFENRHSKIRKPKTKQL